MGKLRIVSECDGRATLQQYAEEQEGERRSKPSGTHKPAGEQKRQRSAQRVLYKTEGATYRGGRPGGANQGYWAACQRGKGVKESRPYGKEQIAWRV